MKRSLWCATFAAFAIVVAFCARGTAQAAPSCSMQSLSLADLVANYDPVKSGVSTNIAAGAQLSFSCTGITSNTVVKIFVSGTATLPASYTTPFLTGPNGFQLPYTLCVPNTGNCTATSGSIWNDSSGYSTNLKSNDSGALQTIPPFSIFIGQKDAYVGTTADYTGSLYFAFKCGSPATNC